LVLHRHLFAGPSAPGPVWLRRLALPRSLGARFRALRLGARPHTGLAEEPTSLPCALGAARAASGVYLRLFPFGTLMAGTDASPMMTSGGSSGSPSCPKSGGTAPSNGSLPARAATTTAGGASSTASSGASGATPASSSTAVARGVSPGGGDNSGAPALAGSSGSSRAASSSVAAMASGLADLAIGDVVVGEVDAEPPDDPNNTCLSHFHQFASFQPLDAGAFTKVKFIRDGIHGKVILYRWRREGLEDMPVIVKKMENVKVDMNIGRETNERNIRYIPRNRPHPEDALNEIGVMSFLWRDGCPSSILRMHGCFRDADYTWFLTDNCEGGELFDLAAGPEPITDVQIQGYMWQLFQAVQFMHGRGVGHRDISLENILLKDGQIRLMDFGQAVRTRSDRGTPLRYFNQVGKPVYRPPECMIPTAAQIQVTYPGADHPCFASGPLPAIALVPGAGGFLCEVELPANAAPGQTAAASPLGYLTEPADLFQCGVCLFILKWRVPPWGHALLLDQRFAYIHSRGPKGVQSLLEAWRKPVGTPDVMDLVSRLMLSDPRRRPTLPEIMANPWFASLPVVDTVPAAAGVAPSEQSWTLAPAASSSSSDDVVMDTAPAAATAASAPAVPPAERPHGSNGRPSGSSIASGESLL